MNTDVDVIVIGAGIHGAWVAREAVAAGYSVCVLEQYDEPARATSSRSSKLVHGGLRYLESGQFALVRECLSERAWLLRNAPHLVRLSRFCIPVYRQTSRRPWKIRLGLYLYTLFSRRCFSTVPSSQWDRLDGLVTHDLEAVFCYDDAQTDDAALTRAVLASAQSLGSHIALGAEVTSVRLNPDGCRARYRSRGKTQEINARVLVNAAGPWVNAVLERVTPAPPMRDVTLVQGTHIVIPGRIRHPYYLEAPQDRRAIFVLPWKNRVMVGTTEHEFAGDPAAVAPLPVETRYLLDVFNHFFDARLEVPDIVESFTGLRVLPAGSGVAFDKPRETLLSVDREHRPRLLTIYGGKLTAARATAAQVLHRVRASLPARKAVADTRHLPLPVIE